MVHAWPVPVPLPSLALAKGVLCQYACLPATFTTITKAHATRRLLVNAAVANVGCAAHANSACASLSTLHAALYRIRYRQTGNSAVWTSARRRNAHASGSLSPPPIKQHDVILTASLDALCAGLPLANNYLPMPKHRVRLLPLLSHPCAPLPLPCLPDPALSAAAAALAQEGLYRWAVAFLCCWRTAGRTRASLSLALCCRGWFWGSLLFIGGGKDSARRAFTGTGARTGREEK